ncbi:MAG: Tim44 domain-containing protein [Burkholderiales bacterium]|nr:Tim44 domain-containing protein [Burkholderiales bacterium]
MTRPLALTLAALAAGTLLCADLADAKRLSGGKSLGAQRQSVAPDKPATPSTSPGSPASASANPAGGTPPGAGAASNPVMPAAPAGASSAVKPAAPAAAPAAGGASRWLGPVAGLAAGLGLAALASHLGFSDELGSFLLIALVALAAIVVVRMLLRRASPAARPMPYAGAGAGLGSTPGGYETQAPPASRFEPVFGGAAPAATPPSRAFPPGFDDEAFAREARKQFLAVQAAHDRHDTSALADVMTPELYREIAHEIDTSGAARPTEIVDVTARVIDVATEDREHWVSVRFTGTAREGGVNEPFDEVWNLVKPVEGASGWLIAGIRQQAPSH